MTLEERFWSKVDKPEGDDACWEWQGSLYRGGYGSFYVGPHRDSHCPMKKAHRIAW